MEIWKDYIYNYQISNLGNIRNKNTNKILKQQITPKGYCYVCVSLGNRNKKKVIRIHRAVAECFIPNLNNSPQVNHIDGNKLNNNIDNLEWCTNGFNLEHAYRNKLRVSLKGTKHPQSKLTKEDVLFIRENYIPYDKNFGCRALAKKFNVKHSAISGIINNKNYKE